MPACCLNPDNYVSRGPAPPGKDRVECAVCGRWLGYRDPPKANAERMHSGKRTMAARTTKSTKRAKR